MSGSKIDEILKEREGKSKASVHRLSEAKGEDKFFSIIAGEGMEENFLELRFKSGMSTCFSYSDLMWFNHDPEAGCLDLEFGGFLVTVEGRGLCPELFNGIKQKRVAWVKEADSDMQDHEGNTTYVASILLTPPKSESEE